MNRIVCGKVLGLSVLSARRFVLLQEQDAFCTVFRICLIPAGGIGSMHQECIGMRLMTNEQARLILRISCSETSYASSTLIRWLSAMYAQRRSLLTFLDILRSGAYFESHAKALAPPTGLLDLVLVAALPIGAFFSSFFESGTLDASNEVLRKPSAGKNLDWPPFATGLGLGAGTWADTVLDVGFVGRRTLIPCSRR